MIIGAQKNKKNEDEERKENSKQVKKIKIDMQIRFINNKNTIKKNKNERRYYICKFNEENKIRIAVR